MSVSGQTAQSFCLKKGFLHNIRTGKVSVAQSYIVADEKEWLSSTCLQSTCAQHCAVVCNFPNKIHSKGGIISRQASDPYR